MFSGKTSRITNMRTFAFARSVWRQQQLAIVRRRLWSSDGTAL